MKKVGNVYPTLFEPQEFEKQGFRKWGDILHHENSKKPLKNHLILLQFYYRYVPNSGKLGFWEVLFVDFPWVSALVTLFFAFLGFERGGVQIFRFFQKLLQHYFQNY